MNAVCAEMHERCQIVEVSWDNIIPALNGYFMGVNPDRQRVLDFTDVYYATPSVMIGAKTDDKEISAAHLRDKAIAVQTGTMYERYVTKHFADSVVKIYQTQDEALQDLNAGRVDYALGDYPALHAFLRTPEGTACCELKGVLPFDVDIFGAGAAGGIRKMDVELKEKLNAAIRAVRASGLYEKINKSYSNYGIMPPQP